MKISEKLLITPETSAELAVLNSVLPNSVKIQYTNKPPCFLVEINQRNVIMESIKDHKYALSKL